MPLEFQRLSQSTRETSRVPGVTTACLVDGGFFLKRYGLCYGPGRPAYQVAKDLFTMCVAHLAQVEDSDRNDLYRIFFYDCPPLQKKVHHPITSKPIDFSKTDDYRFRHDLHLELISLRKVALRLGRLAEKRGGWVLTEKATRAVLSQVSRVTSLVEDDVEYNIEQKGVDMCIGLDIASLAYKKLVRRIILVAGDADFVPAAKLARREGIDFILDPMWQPVAPDLHEHIDGLVSRCPKPGSFASSGTP